MQVRKACAIGFDREHCAIAQKTSCLCGSIKHVVRQDQTGIGISSVTIGGSRGGIESCETMQVRKTRSIDVNREHGAIAGKASSLRGAIQDIGRQHQTRIVISSVTVGGSRSGIESRETMQV